MINIHILVELLKDYQEFDKKAVILNKQSISIFNFEFYFNQCKITIIILISINQFLGYIIIPYLMPIYINKPSLKKERILNLQIILSTPLRCFTGW